MMSAFETPPDLLCQSYPTQSVVSTSPIVRWTRRQTLSDLIQFSLGLASYAPSIVLAIVSLSLKRKGNRRADLSGTLRIPVSKETCSRSLLTTLSLSLTRRTGDAAGDRGRVVNEREIVPFPCQPQSYTPYLMFFD